MSNPLNRGSLHLYHRTTRSATYGFLAALPLLILYEVLIWWTHRGAIGEVRIGADVWLKQLFSIFGGAGVTLISVAIVLVGIGILYFERDRYIPLKARYFGGIVLESMGYALVLTAIIAGFVGAVFLTQAAGTQPTFMQQVALSIGSGVYEELFFRVLLVGGLFLGFLQFMPNRMRAYIWAAFIGALIFSAVHYIGPLGDAFTIASFTYRFLFGLALNALFLWRGFAVVAWTHSLYNLMLLFGVL